MCRFPYAITAVMVAVSTVFPISAASASDTLQRIEERARERSQIVKWITTGRDRNLRISALQEALQHQDNELRHSARAAALASNDSRLRRIALANLLTETATLHIELSLPDRPSPAQQVVYDEFYGLRFSDIKVDDNTNAIVIRQRNPFWTGSLTDQGFRMVFRRTRPYSDTFRCSMNVKFVSASLMSGSFSCQIFQRDDLKKAKGQNRAKLPLKINF